MQKIFLCILLFCNTVSAQVENQNESESNKGWFLGLGFGAGTLLLKYNDTAYHKLSTTLPNIKIGYRINKKIAVCFLVPGANYKYHKKDRGFEAFVPAVQYWINKHWWTLIGIGATFDAPAFYTVKDPKKAPFYTGIPAITFATGYEVYQRNKFTLDIQYRFFWGQSLTDNHKYRTGISNMLIAGVNWKL